MHAIYLVFVAVIMSNIPAVVVTRDGRSVCVPFSPENVIISPNENMRGEMAEFAVSYKYDNKKHPLRVVSGALLVSGNPTKDWKTGGPRVTSKGKEMAVLKLKCPKTTADFMLLDEIDKHGRQFTQRKRAAIEGKFAPQDTSAAATTSATTTTTTQDFFKPILYEPAEDKSKFDKTPSFTLFGFNLGRLGVFRNGTEVDIHEAVVSGSVVRVLYTVETLQATSTFTRFSTQLHQIRVLSAPTVYSTFVFPQTFSVGAGDHGCYVFNKPNNEATGSAGPMTPSLSQRLVFGTAVKAGPTMQSPILVSGSDTELQIVTPPLPLKWDLKAFVEKDKGDEEVGTEADGATTTTTATSGDTEMSTEASSDTTTTTTTTTTSATTEHHDDDGGDGDSDGTDNDNDTTGTRVPNANLVIEFRSDEEKRFEHWLKTTFTDTLVDLFVRNQKDALNMKQRNDETAAILARKMLEDTGFFRQKDDYPFNLYIGLNQNTALFDIDGKRSTAWNELVCAGAKVRAIFTLRLSNKSGQRSVVARAVQVQSIHNPPDYTQAWIGDDWDMSQSMVMDSTV